MWQVIIMGMGNAAKWYGFVWSAVVFWMLLSPFEILVLFSCTSFCTLLTDNIEAHIESAKDNVVKAGGELEQAEHHQVSFLLDNYPIFFLYTRIKEFDLLARIYARFMYVQ